MDFTHTETYRIRSYECDIYGHMNNAIYLRYLQETALRASAAAGEYQDYLSKISRHGWTPYIDIEYFVPLYYGETVKVTYRLLDMQGDLIRQEYQLHKMGEREPAAKAMTASGYLDHAAGSAAKLDRDFAAAFFPQSPPDQTKWPMSFPSAPPRPPGAFKVQRGVAWQDVNPAQQVDPALLLAYIEDCGRQVVAAHGWPMERMMSEGFAILLRRNQIEYIRPAYLDDELEIVTWVSNVRRATATRHYTVTRLRDHEILARVHSLGVWVNLQNGQPIRIPPDMLADFAANIV